MFLALMSICTDMQGEAQPGVRVHMHDGTRMDVPFATIDRVTHGQDPVTALPELPAISVSMIAPRHYRVQVAPASANGGQAFGRGVCWSRKSDAAIRDSLLATAPDGSCDDTLVILVEGTTFTFRAYAVGDGYVHYGPATVLQIPLLPPGSGVVDADGNIYPTGLIGGQEWMLDNLRTTRYANGDAIPEITENVDWYLSSSAARCYPALNAQGEAQLYGVIYNGLAMVDPRNVCPTGWHVPTDEDWKVLEGGVGVPVTDLDQTGVRGTAQQAGGALKATTNWPAPNTGATNSTGFAALPAGFRSGSSGTFFDVGYTAFFWTAPAAQGQMVRTRALSNAHAGIERSPVSYGAGASIRCVRD
jgi:uncharacterized protein (TIGR02145 family)